MSEALGRPVTAAEACEAALAEALLEKCRRDGALFLEDVPGPLTLGELCLMADAADSLVDAGELRRVAPGAYADAHGDMDGRGLARVVRAADGAGARKPRTARTIDGGLTVAR